MRSSRTLVRGQSLIWVRFPSLDRLLAPRPIKQSPATSQIEDNFNGFPTVMIMFMFT